MSPVPESAVPRARYSANRLNVGIDVGSTTAKVAVVDPQSREVVFERYIRHHANQTKAVFSLLDEISALFPESHLRAAFCGSGGSLLA